MLTGFQIKKGCFLGQPLSAGEILSALSSEKISTFQKIRRRICFDEGEFIFQKDEIPQNIYIFSNGAAKICANQKNSCRDIRLLQKDEIIGLHETLGNFPPATFVETLAPCAFDLIERASLIDFLLSEPQVCFRLLKKIGGNLQKNYQIISNLNN